MWLGLGLRFRVYGLQLGSGLRLGSRRQFASRENHIPSSLALILLLNMQFFEHLYFTKTGNTIYT